VAYCLLCRELPVSSTSSEILEGHGYVSPDNNTYHTYVLGQPGPRAFDCRGGAVGGTRLCHASGSLRLADCIYDRDLAGIHYGQTGVCHQIANRVLSAAGISIPPSSHRHVRFSHLAYGKFGRNIRGVVPVTPDRCWPQRKIRCEFKGASASAGSSDLVHFSTGIGDPMVHIISSRDEPDPKVELSELIQAGLGHTVSDGTLSALCKMQGQLQYRISEAAGLLAQHKITRRDYLERLDIALREASKVGAILIGEKEFRQVFGEMTTENLIDADIFLSTNDD
jgi:hypothetical protein